MSQQLHHRMIEAAESDQLRFHGCATKHRGRLRGATADRSVITERGEPITSVDIACPRRPHGRPEIGHGTRRVAGGDDVRNLTARHTDTHRITKSLLGARQRPIPIAQPLKPIARIEVPTGRRWKASAWMPRSPAASGSRCRDRFARHQTWLADN